MFPTSKLYKLKLFSCLTFWTADIEAKFLKIFNELLIFSLKAEWLYSQGQGRKFHIGQHTALVRYLTETCPITSHALETEQERKLRLVLSKAQQYREQLHSIYLYNLNWSEFLLSYINLICL